jgi:group I intron endonuclease
MGYIYKIVNNITGKMYIGETVEKDPEERWRGHQNAFRKGRGCPALRDAIQKYGIENFRFEVMVICFDEARFEMEREYIKRYNTLVPNGYNILEGGVGGAGFKGKRHSEEVRRLISEHSKRNAQNPEYIKRCSERATEQMRKVKELGIEHGKKVKESEKYRKALEEGRVGGAGRIPTEETKKKTSESVKAYYAKHAAHSVNVESHRKVMAAAVGVKVEKYDLEDNLLETYDSIAAAARACCISKGSIDFCLSGRHKTGGGFKWKRATEPVKNEVMYTT